MTPGEVCLLLIAGTYFVLKGIGIGLDATVSACHCLDVLFKFARFGDKEIQPQL